MQVKTQLMFNSDDIRVLVINKMNNILKNIDNNSKREIRNQLDCLKELILKY